jgi:hypothetical protein
VIILQYVEGLTDRQAAEAVRTRIDWKYLLCLEITDVGFDYSVLSEFRTRLIESSWEQKVFEVLLARILCQGLLKAGGQQRTDATLVLGSVRDLSRLEMVGETLRSALNSLSIVAPDWMRMHYQEAWLDRYGVRVQNYRLPTSQIQRDEYADVIGSDGLALLLSILHTSSGYLTYPSGFGIIFGLLSPVHQPILGVADNQGIEPENTEHRKTQKTLSFRSSTKHKQAINISSVAFGYDLQGCVNADRQQLAHSCGGDHSGLS